MTLRLRTLLLASTAPALAFSAHAAAVDVADGRTTPIATSSANNGAADNVTITSAGSITLTSGVAVTVDSNNSATNSGRITITGADGATGFRVLGGFSGTILNGGTIILDEDYTRTDADEDGTLDGPFAQGSGRTGILIEGPAAFTGEIRNTGPITIEGNSSRGIDLQTDLTGSLVHQGTISMLGDQNIGVRVGGNVSGDVRVSGGVSVTGEGSTGVVIAGDVAGGVTNGGSVQSTGFQYPAASNYFDPDDVAEGFEPPPLDADDLKDNAPAFMVAGNVAEGVLNNGAVSGGDADDDEDGEDPVKDLPGDFNPNRSTGSISSLGSAPAVLISPESATGDIVIGIVVEKVRDTTDDDDDDDREEILATFRQEHGFVNRGSISANGVNVGFNANTVVIEGSQDGTRDAIIEGGVANTGTITSQAREANATTVRFGSGARFVPDPINPGVTPSFSNAGAMSATTNTETNHRVTVLLIEAGSLVQALSNSGSISASARGDAAQIFAIQDLSGTLLSISNTGNISATFLNDSDDDDGDGFFGDADERTGQTVAIDLSAHGAGQNASIVQTLATPTRDANNDGVIDSNDVAPPTIVGDVRLGGGDDDVQLLAGRMAGDLAFGAGADTLAIDGGAIYAGTLSDADGQLTVSVDDGEMRLAEDTNITVTSLALNDQSTTTFAIDLRAGSTANAHIVADAISIAAGAQITPQFVGLGSTTATEIEILRSESGLTLGGAVSDNLGLDTPFLFAADLTTRADGPAESVIVTVRRRSADELGMSANHAAAYEPVVAALNTDEELLVKLVNLTTSEEFYDAYDQLLPEFSFSAMQFAVANVDGTLGAVGNRLDAVRGGRAGSGAAWIQEFGQFLDRESSFSDPGYRGNGFGMAFGMDRPLGPLYAVGINFSGASSQIEQPYGTDTPLSVATAQVGAYAAANVGNLLLDLYAGAGADFFESERIVTVGTATRQTTGEWKAHHGTATARLAYDINMRRLFARPALSVDYFRMDEESYTETGDSLGSTIALALDERSSDMLATTASLTLGAQFGSMDRTWWSPRLRVGYRQESFGGPQLTTARYLAGGDPFTLRADDLPDTGGLVGFTFAAGSRWSSFALDYDADVREGFVRHGVRVAFRFIF